MDETVKRLLPIYILVFLRGISLSLSVDGPVMPLYIRYLGISVADWGILATVFAIGLISFEVFWGTMSDRLNRRMILLAAVLMLSSVFPFYTFKVMIPYFFVFQFLMGSFYVMIGPASRATVADQAPIRQMGVYMSLWSTSVTFGRIIGPILGGYISEKYAYEYAFYASSFFLLLAGLVILLAGNKIPSSTKKSSGVHVDYLVEFFSVFKIGKIRVAFLLAMCIFIGTAAVSSFLPIYATEYLGMTNLSIGIIFTVGSLVQLISTPFLGRLADHVDVEKLLVVCFGLMAFLFFSFAFVSSNLLVSLLTVGILFCLTGGSLSLILISRVAPREKLGMVMGMFGSFEDLGLIFGPIVFGFLWEFYGPISIFVASGVVCLVPVFVLLFMPVD